MIKVGITGTIGSGKSTVSTILTHLGYSVFDSDQEAKEVYNSKVIQEQINSLFIKELAPMGGVTRENIANLVFSDPKKLAQLNAIIHPPVFKRWDYFCTANKNHTILFCESAILFNSGFDAYVDKTLAVIASKEVCIARIQQRDNLSLEAIERRMGNQMNPTELEQRADIVIENNGTTLLTLSVLSFLKKIGSSQV